ncbi:SGNH/GDSL hydrolase family protein [Yersinia intermedia]|uniref:SGNH/GDSL hydrolase family protein n=1 Tax=Yersinia intermedia TaxID=631 RepID=UPI0005DE8FC4|nr:SGNH/GDSL hydrolase family protein [Yersinia intermedia]MDN0115452.1 SGNH/GDSL hydrolase family protein [Yersinia intermedia]CNC74030.1 Uncharacterised protein [Yersinia intermedia]
MKLICSFGSCLSASVAEQLSKMFDNWLRISSVQHNRIDQFDQIYIKEIYPRLTKNNIGLTLLDEFNYVNTIDNQLADIGLGRALPKKEDKVPLNNILSCIESGKVDIFIFDNFAELFFKLYEHIELKTPMFINEKYLTEKADKFTFNNSFISVESYVLSYSSVFEYITSKNPGCKIIFLPFPISLKNDKNLKSRSDLYLEAINGLTSTFENIYIHSEIEISTLDLLRENDIYHFNDRAYNFLAKNIIKHCLT